MACLIFRKRTRPESASGTKFPSRWGYQDFAPGADEHAALNGILNDAFSHRHLRYLTDQDARPAGSSSSVAHLWDSGANAVDELERLMKVRAAALRRFGENNIREGAPLATIEDVLVPIYLLHRYQVEAASKLVGGMDYTYRAARRRRNAYAYRRGGGATSRAGCGSRDAETRRTRVAGAAAENNSAAPGRLRARPRRLQDSHQPRVRRAGSRRKLRRSTRCNSCSIRSAPSRLVEFHARDEANPRLDEVLHQILATTDTGARSAGYLGEVGRVVDNVALYDLMVLAGDAQAAVQVRAVASIELDRLKQRLAAAATHRTGLRFARTLFFGAAQIEQFQKDPAKLTLTAPSEPPDGPPIGADDDFERAMPSPMEKSCLKHSLRSFGHPDRIGQDGSAA